METLRLLVVGFFVWSEFTRRGSGGLFRGKNLTQVSRGTKTNATEIP